jgi:hypothetical protein
MATSEFRLPLWAAALCVPDCVAVLVLPLEVAEVEEGTLRVELTTAEVVGLEAFALAQLGQAWTATRADDG